MSTLDEEIARIKQENYQLTIQTELYKLGVSRLLTEWTK